MNYELINGFFIACIIFTCFGIIALAIYIYKEICCLADYEELKIKYEEIYAELDNLKFEKRCLDNFLIQRERAIYKNCKGKKYHV